MPTKRVHYIDVFKGILIVLVVIHHIPYVLENTIPEKSIIGIRWIQNIIVGFFMPAFFVATGRCTNFKIPFPQYLWKNVKTILIPCFCLYYFNHWLSCVNALYFKDASWVTWSHFLSPGIRTFLREGGFYWFLIALFLSKVIYYFVCVINCHLRWRFLISLLLSVAGVACSELWTDSNYFFWQHALALVVFLPIGESLQQYSKHVTKWRWLLLFAYLLIISLFTQLQYHAPSVTRTMDVTLLTMPLYLFLSVVGSLGVWYLAEHISHNRIVEYWGRNSMTIYAFNYIVSTIALNVLLLFIQPESNIQVTILFLITIVIDLALLSILSWLFNRKILRLSLGKF